MTTKTVVPAPPVIPAKAGIPAMTTKTVIPAPPVIPAKAGIPAMTSKTVVPALPVIPAKAGIPAMTTKTVVPAPPVIPAKAGIPAMTTKTAIPALPVIPAKAGIPAMTTKQRKEATMNKIEKLITELCSNGVEFTRLGELGEFENIGVDKKIVDGQTFVMLLNFMDIMRNKHITKDLLSMEVTASDSKIEKCDIKKYDIFITPSSETRDEIGFTAVVDEDIPNAVYSYHIMRYRLYDKNAVTPYFISYLFESNDLRNQIFKASKGLTRFGLSAKDFAKLQIPLPPLPIQQEIVSILDKFTQLEAELEAELEARKKQYEYYRERLMINDKWLMVSLGEVCDVFTGGEAPDNCIKGENPDEENKYAIYANGIEVYGYTNTYKIDKDSVTISSIGANTGAIYYRKAYFTPIIRLKVVVPKKENLLSRFLFHYLSSIEINSKKSSVPNMNANDVKKIKIPLPPLAEQARIVEILDKFDALVNDISAGLPAEIKMRRQQYEYYRNKLLTFEEVA
jgi:type I restriction enzyme S subunit